MTKIAMVGGSGFVGSEVGRYLGERGYTVYLLDIKPPRKLVNNVDFVFCDVTDHSYVQGLLRELEPSFLIYSAIVQIPRINEEPRLAYEVNVAGLDFVCRFAEEHPEVRGVVLTGSWHVYRSSSYGGSGLLCVDLDRVEERERLYCVHKILQECIIRAYARSSPKVFGVLRLGTVLGEGMPEKTAANVFITQALSGKPITPYAESALRPLIYVDIEDVCRAFESYVSIALRRGKEEVPVAADVCWPESITVLELANLVKDLVVELSGGEISPVVEVVGDEALLRGRKPERVWVDVSVARDVLGLEKLISPRESLKRLISRRMGKMR